MHVLVRMMVTGKTVVISTSRTTEVKDLKKIVESKFNVKANDQRLFFSGKQLENQYRLFDYSININDVIQLMVKTTVESGSQKMSQSEITNNLKNAVSIPSSSATSSSASDEDNSEETTDNSQYFKPGDFVDVKDCHYGAWFMGKLIKIKKDTAVEVYSDPKSSVKNDGLIYVVEFLRSEDPYIEVHLQEIRPVASEILPLHELQSGDKVLANYNAEYPKERGYWYESLIKEKKPTRKGGFNVIADVTVGMDNAMLSNCNLMFPDSIYKIKPHQFLANRTPEDIKIMETEPAEFRFSALNCITCKDDENKSCKDCGCQVCGGKDNDDKQLMCDECDLPYHMACLSPPLKVIPEEDEWYCPSCKNDENEIVKVGGKLKVSKKKTRESTATSKRDWGKGMACVGRTKHCYIVPKTHFGPIPGVEVGTTWKFRVQVSEAGIHRPPVAGIHGRDGVGAYSIVLSGGYEDDVDYGDKFLYTGSGGRDLSGNKRTALQSCDQVLTRYNRALALNCNAKLNDVKGATALDWKKGKPVRVVRNYKLKKHSEFAPEEGNRYDGIYKVVKYYPEKGLSGFNVWRYVLRRDDPTPAPWTIQGKKRIAQLGLETIYPENYVDPNETNEQNPTLSGLKKRAVQETGSEVNDESDESEIEDCGTKHTNKKLKLQYKLEKELDELIITDTINKKYWDDCKELLDKGKKAFLDKVEESFMCICCQEIVFEPITTKCSHIICKDCLKRSFNADVFQCPSCRFKLGEDYPMDINENLAKILLFLFPGYTTGR